jgi:hypothetical protein
LQSQNIPRRLELSCRIRDILARGRQRRRRLSTITSSNIKSIKLSTKRDSHDLLPVPQSTPLILSDEIFKSELASGSDQAQFALASSSNPSSPRPPPFSSLDFESPASRAAARQVNPLLRERIDCFEFSESLAVGPAPPFESSASASPLESEVKAALPRDTKGESSGKAPADEKDPPPPYTEGSSPLSGFNYVMAAAGGAASIITQVQQGGPAPVNSLGGELIEGIGVE